jgi:hypothetical protein
MFWYLLFAHLLADYPLQSNWMVLQKTRFRILLLHVATHFGILVLVVGMAWRTTWPYILALTIFHLLVDLFKNYVNKVRPSWIVGPYIIDQIIHYLSIWIVAAWIESRTSSQPLPFTRGVLIIASVYLLITYVWFISERILVYSNTSYRKEVVEQLWTRMVSRALMLSGLLLVWRWLAPVSLSATTAASSPYFRGKNGVRALLTDISVAVAGFILIALAL